MIEINSVSKSFDDKKVFENFSEKIEKGEFIIFSGESGCGKTTLLNMIGGIEKIDKGTITVDGIDISQRKNKLSYFQNKVGFLFQNFALVEEKTVEQNLTIVRGAQTADILKVLERVGLKGYENKKVYKLSGGEQQRVALARLMLKSCDLILADEPTGSLDKKNAMLVMDILKELNKENKTIILVTHDEEIKKMGTRTITLGEGK
ncbi:MAG: ATP-binding cassette domain-containing protein [Oscillospiraceae bacterium]|nr:ATP-binding cassette domain-containing protein [Oscillospiraceae bacterium]